MNINGTTSGDEIYGNETDRLYNQIFGGKYTEGASSFDFFLTLDPVTKLVIMARIHVTKTFEQYDVDCVNLELM
ncbi:MAG: hypothetical protein HC902_04585 [Calothrix sp. SM1_5_4]|nr:hypothetical protein [Calothrix sp. SM1_5_4]